MAIGAQCGVLNQHAMLELTPNTQNYPQYMEFCHKPLPIVAVQGPLPRRLWLFTMAIGNQFGVWNQPPTLELTSDKQNQAKYMDFCHKTLPIIAVQSPQPRRWWLLTMTTGAQCGVWNRLTTLELTSDKQNKAKYMNLCHKPLPIIAVQYPQHPRWWLHTWPLGSSVVFEIDPQRLNWRQTNKTNLNTWILLYFVPWPLGPSVMF